MNIGVDFYDKLYNKIRHDIESGTTLEEAIISLLKEGVGILHLIEPVSKILECDRNNALKTIVRIKSI